MDIEKIIKGLHCCAHTDGISCVLCPYDIADEDCTALMSMDVLDLLKEQEPVKPKYTPKSIYSWECGVCAEPFDRIANYCPKCGRAVKWDG